MTSRMMTTSKSTQIDCRAVNTQQLPQEAREKADGAKERNTNADCPSHRTATAQKNSKSQKRCLTIQKYNHWKCMLWRRPCKGRTASTVPGTISIVLNVMHHTALRRIDAITMKPNSTFFCLKKKHHICRTVQTVSNFHNLCIMLYIENVERKKGLFHIYTSF